MSNVGRHICVDCAALPADQQPRKPRSAPHGGPRSRRCSTHYRIRQRAVRHNNHETRVLRTYGLSSEEFSELWEYQGRQCPCGCQPSRKPDTDHDHRCCSQLPTCGKCNRGLLCRACNTFVIGRYNSTQLRALADYLDDPPLVRMRREHNGSL